MKKLSLFLVTVLAAALVAGATSRPAPAVIHEMVAAWCSGKGDLEPPGLSNDERKNFAMPLFAGGVVQLTPFQGGFLIDFDFTKPQAKIVPAPTGPAIVQIAPGLFIERFIIDPNFPAFENCKALQALAG